MRQSLYPLSWLVLVCFFTSAGAGICLFPLLLYNIPLVFYFLQQWIEIVLSFTNLELSFNPFKRYKVTNVGFDRYNCVTSAEVATAKSNGFWIEDRKLYVKFVVFKEQGKKP